MPKEIPLFTASAEDRTGAGRRRLAEAVTAGRLEHVRAGVYVDAAEFRALDARERHVVSMRAFAARRPKPPLFSHRSAAVVQGLPLLRLPGVVEVTTDGDDLRHLKDVRRYSGLIDAALDTQIARGLIVTTLARTAVDLARIAPFDEAVVVLDAAMGRLGRERVEAAAARSTSRASAARFDRALAFADGASGSPGESVSRVTMHTIGLPAPILQQEFFDADGFAARGDFWFREQGVVGEMDGQQKYFDPAMTKGDPAAVVYREKVREDRLRAMGVVVVRWDWATACDPRRLGALLARVGVVPTRR